MSWHARRSVLKLHKQIAKREREELVAARRKGEYHPRLSLSEKLGKAVAASYIRATKG
jgi:hypothetical protein